MNVKPEYIIADHIRAACFIIADGVKPSGKQRGYILRRLIRRSLSAATKLNIDITNQNYFKDLVNTVLDIYDGVYPELIESKDLIISILSAESQKYSKAITRGQKEWSKVFKKAGI